MKNKKYLPEKVLIFDLKGPFAHFRKYYTNSSSLTYLMPPRTVLAGLTGGILGLPSERHPSEGLPVFYEIFSPGRSFFSVALHTPVRKMMQTVNYLFAKTSGSRIEFSKHAQIPIEILAPMEGDELVYRIFFGHEDEEVMTRLEEKLKNAEIEFPPYLGLTEFIGRTDLIGTGKVEAMTPSSGFTEVDGIVKADYVEKLNNEDGQRYVVESMPVYFSGLRNPHPPEDYLTEASGKRIRVQLKPDSPLLGVEMEGIEGGKYHILPM